jgi:hypothetical protein
MHHEIFLLFGDGLHGHGFGGHVAAEHDDGAFGLLLLGGGLHLGFGGQFGKNGLIDAERHLELRVASATDEFFERPVALFLLKLFAGEIVRHGERKRRALQFGLAMVKPIFRDFGFLGQAVHQVILVQLQVFLDGHEGRGIVHVQHHSGHAQKLFFQAGSQVNEAFDGRFDGHQQAYHHQTTFGVHLNV